MTYMKSEALAEATAHGHVKRPLLKVIRSKCLDCCVGQPGEVRLCQFYDCDLWPFRMGKNPFTNISGTLKPKNDS